MTTRHPPSNGKPLKKPDPARDGFSQNSGTALQLEKNWRRRDNPEVSERQTHIRNAVWKPNV